MLQRLLIPFQSARFVLPELLHRLRPALSDLLHAQLQHLRARYPAIQPALTCAGRSLDTPYRSRVSAIPEGELIDSFHAAAPRGDHQGRSSYRATSHTLHSGTIVRPSRCLARTRLSGPASTRDAFSRERPPSTATQRGGASQPDSVGNAANFVHFTSPCLCRPQALSTNAPNAHHRRLRGDIGRTASTPMIVSLHPHPWIRRGSSCFYVKRLWPP